MTSIMNLESSVKDSDLDRVFALEKKEQMVIIGKAMLLFSPFLEQFFKQNTALPNVDVGKMLRDIAFPKGELSPEGRLFKKNFGEIMFDADTFTGWYDEFTQGILLGVYDYVEVLDKKGIETTNFFHQTINLIADISDELNDSWASALGFQNSTNILTIIESGSMQELIELVTKIHESLYSDQ